MKYFGSEMTPPLREFQKIDLICWEMASLNDSIVLITPVIIITCIKVKEKATFIQQKLEAPLRLERDKFEQYIKGSYLI